MIDGRPPPLTDTERQFVSEGLLLIGPLGDPAPDDWLPRLLDEVEAARRLLREWVDTDHCHGHICGHGHGTCGSFDVEAAARAFLGEREGSEKR